MSNRIALSTLCFLLLLAGACAADDVADDAADSGQDALASEGPYSTALPACGIWRRDTSAHADAAALACAKPDAIVFANGWSSCADAVVLAGGHWPNQAAVRTLDASLRATGAVCADR
jgi:hypothetical protein